MSNITTLVERSLRTFPDLFKTRLDVLKRMFSKSSGNFYIDDNGDMSIVGLDDCEEWTPMPIDGSRSDLNIIRDNALNQFVMDHSAAIAASSTHDELSSVSELSLPSRWEHTWEEHCTWDELTVDTQDALLEVLRHYMNELGYTEYNDGDLQLRHTCTTKSWNLSKEGVNRGFQSALVLMEQITGKTREQRRLESVALTEKLIAEMREEGTL